LNVQSILVEQRKKQNIASTTNNFQKHVNAA